MRLTSSLRAASIALALAVTAAGTHAGPREQAKRLHDRLAGVPPSDATLQQMADAIAGGDAIAAAYRAMEHPAFYDATLTTFAAPWTNRDQDVFVPLNDFTATVVGMVRDDVDFRQVLYGDIVYVGDSQYGLPPYSLGDNRHYEEIESRGLPLRDVLERRTQSQVSSLPSQATAGVMTTRAGAQAFFIAGTNRAMFRFTLINFLCRDLESVKDGTAPPDRIRQDVARSPGGDSRVFMNNCVTCHAGMDPLAQAFAYYDFTFDADADPTGRNGTLIYNDVGATDPATGTRVVRKYFANETTFAPGFRTPDDSWENYWRRGTNATLGWDPSLPGSGSGAKSMGQELAHSQAFAQCQVEKAFQTTCLRAPENSADRAEIARITQTFASSGYQMKQAFAETAVYCMGD